MTDAQLQKTNLSIKLKDEDKKRYTANTIESANMRLAQKNNQRENI